MPDPIILDQSKACVQDCPAADDQEEPEQCDNKVKTIVKRWPPTQKTLVSQRSIGTFTREFELG